MTTGYTFVASAKAEKADSRHLYTTPNDVRANLPVCPNLTASKRAMLAEPWEYARENIAPLVLVEVWAARQRRPTLEVSGSIYCHPIVTGLSPNRNCATIVRVLCNQG
jgi:hypothetical protein